MTRTLASLAATALFGGGSLLCALAGTGERQTFPLDPTTDQLLFVGIQADYDALGMEEATRLLREDLELRIAGESLRSLSNVQRRVWAVRSKDPDATLKDLKRSAKKKDLVIERLFASVVTAGRDPLNNSVARAMEGVDERVWAAWLGIRGEEVWLFHESKLTTKTLEKALGAAKLPNSWQHQAFDLSSAAEVPPDFALLESAAADKLDLLHATRGAAVLSLDVYLRGMDGLRVVQQESQTRFCPDFYGKLVGAAAPGTEGWKLTFQPDGFPFL